MNRWIVLVTMTTLLGCSGAGSRRADLVGDLRNYGEGVRWNDFAKASLVVHPKARADFMDTREQVADDLKISDWEMKRLTYSDNRNKADVQVEWYWHLDSRGIMHTTVTTQKWTRHGKRWIIDEERRLRGEPMPGVAEPQKKPKHKPKRRSAQSKAEAAP